MNEWFLGNVLSLLFTLTSPTPVWAEAPVFRFHSAQEPAAVDPLALAEATGGFLFYNLYRGLYRVTGDGALTPELAESCEWQDPTRLILVCKLRPGIRFSNGEKIEARHFVSAWRRIADPHSGSRHAELLAHFAGYARIVAGKAPVGQLGVRAMSASTLEIQLERPDPELLYKLASPILTPLFKAPPVRPKDFSQAITSGPYRVKAWVQQSRIDLDPNPHYFRKRSRPPLQVLMVEEDATALQMFDLNKLTLLRRLAVQEIESRKGRPEFLFIPLFRFDYFGFGPALHAYPELRKALSLALNYPELTAAYKTPGEVGCPPLPRRLATPYPCHRFDPLAAQAAFNTLPKKIREQRWALSFSKASGEDVDRGMEWMQAQWKKHLGLTIELKPLERVMYLRELRSRPPPLFRKTLNLDRPTCTAALENFLADSPDNSIRLRAPEFDQLTRHVAEEPNGDRKNELCGQALKFLMDGYHLIPLGEMYQAMLIHRKPFTGWKITPLNQLDLTDLEVAK